ncbi:dihydroorotase [Boudabousia liubingyangii]|uniref:dihydroorotase n=1 Tax=Boudabousia liubingyangii TaxID=1921764 RepID=UPI000939FDCD|nr:dihydroorotase [Boudabousia liubingyangii]OKL47684.1 dihydroorotase [Boudabousia liubingyangii]
MTQYLIKNVSIEGAEPTDLAFKDGQIVGRGPQAAETVEDPQVIDGTNLVALRGLVDLHTHLREPGGSAAETVYTGTRSAAVGGYTCVHAMANTSPVADNALVVEKVLELGERAGFVQVCPVGAVSKNLEGHALAELGAMNKSKAQVKVFSDDGKCVWDSALMRRALEYVSTFDGVIAQHAQEPTLTAGSQMNEGVVSGQLGLRGWPAAAEEIIVARDIILAEHLNARVHVCHLSTAGSVRLVRDAKARGVKITAEATPHHLYLTDEQAHTLDARFKVNPPLRTENDRLAVLEGLRDGTIDIVGTDHAPHPAQTKDCPWDEAAFGMTGLETALPIIIKTMVQPGHFTWEQVVQVLSVNPARIGGVSDQQGRPLEVGEPANLCLVDPSVTRVVDPDRQYSKSKNTPYAGMELPGQVLYTFYQGKMTVKEGRPVEEGIQ